ncbi:MAG: hypothetical protein NVSMB18_30110 [Acetobacteraceae bacterium]
MAQDGGNIAVGAVDQAEHDVLDFDIIMCTRQCLTGGALEGPAGQVVHAPDKGFEIDCCCQNSVPTVSIVDTNVLDRAGKAFPGAS